VRTVFWRAPLARRRILCAGPRWEELAEHIKVLRHANRATAWQKTHGNKAVSWHPGNRPGLIVAFPRDVSLSATEAAEPRADHPDLGSLPEKETSPDDVNGRAMCDFPMSCPTA